MDDYDAGYLYECRFINDFQTNKTTTLIDKITEPIRAVPIGKSDPTHDDVPLTCIIKE
jgi:hypothetical protein